MTLPASKQSFMFENDMKKGSLGQRQKRAKAGKPRKNVLLLASKQKYNLCQNNSLLDSLSNSLDLLRLSARILAFLSWQLPFLDRKKSQIVIMYFPIASLRWGVNSSVGPLWLPNFGVFGRGQMALLILNRMAE